MRNRLDVGPWFKWLSSLRCKQRNYGHLTRRATLRRLRYGVTNESTRSCYWRKFKIRTGASSVKRNMIPNIAWCSVRWGKYNNNKYHQGRVFELLGGHLGFPAFNPGKACSTLRLDDQEIREEYVAVRCSVVPYLDDEIVPYQGWQANVSLKTSLGNIQTTIPNTTIWRSVV